MNPPINITPELLQALYEQANIQVPSGITPQGYPEYQSTGLNLPQQTQTQPFSQPQNLDELNNLFRSGQISQEQYDTMFEQVPEYNYSQKDLGVLADFNQYSEENTGQQLPDYSRLFTNLGAGVSMEGALFNIGRYAGMESGTTGKGIGLAGSIGKAVFAGARNIASGVGYSKRNEYVKDYYQDQQSKVNYTPAPQYQNSNIIGGYSYGQNGGVFTNTNGFSERYPDEKNLPKQQRSAITLFPNRYGDTNYFLEADENFKNQIRNEDVSLSDYVPVENRSFWESRKLAQEFNKRTREQNLPYRKVKPNAFVVKDANDNTSFENGGEMMQPSNQMSELNGYRAGQTITFQYGDKIEKGVIDRIENGQIFLK